MFLSINFILSQAAKSSPKQHGLIKCSPTFDRLKRLVLKRMSRAFISDEYRVDSQKTETLYLFLVVADNRKHRACSSQ